MLILYALREAYQSLTTHTSRTLSMGFGILWAIFVLVLLLGAGNGFHNGISNEFAKFGEKTMIIWADSTTRVHYPIPEEMASNLSNQFNAIQHITPLRFRYNSIMYKDKVAAPLIVGVNCCYALLANLSIKEGRFFTARDEATTDNLCVIGLRIKEALFGKETAINKYIWLGSMSLQVVGVLDELDNAIYDESNAILLTNSFVRKLFPGSSRYVDSIRLTLVPTAQEELVETQFLSYFARYLNFNIKNIKGFNIFSMAKHANKFHNFFKKISILTWIIGICFLITGIVGVSNMMLVTIHERTQEIAIRRVLGGHSVEIMAMIICEVAIVTFIAGMIGLTAGFMLIQLLNQWVVPLFKANYLSTLTCPLESIVGGLGLTFLANCLASILPAIRAVKIKPVQALSSK